MKRKLFSILLCILCLAMIAATATASEALTARLEGNTLYIAWPTNVGSSCVLKVYRNGWPAAVLNVNGTSGGTSVALGDASGTITVRLQTGTCTLTCDAKGGAAAPANPTHAPVKATPKPTVAPTRKPTSKPTAAPTPVATKKPAEAPSEGTSKPSLAAQVIAQTNAERAKQGLGALRESGELNRAAAVRAREIVQKFSHTRPDGSSWSTVSGSVYGENIARGQNTADKVMAAWLTSEGHRANILRASFGSIGVCAYVYNGVTYWVQLFGH